MFKVNLAGREFDCQIKSYKQSKSIRLRISHEGLLKASKPFWVSQKKVLNFIFDNQDWILNQIDKISQNKVELDFGNYQQDKEKARELILNRLEYFSQFYNFKVNKVFVRNQATRWGSCSTQKNLNFNYRILYLDLELADYVVVHEICHLFEMNHSADFWKLVEQQIPDYKDRRKRLRKILI